MKRSTHLKTLSFEHHDGLVMARKIELTFKDTDKPEEMITYIKEIYPGALDHHFLQEEESLLPALRKFKEAEIMVFQVQKEHRKFLSLYEAVCKQDEHVFTHIQEFGKLLHDHIRFEERVFFPLAEKLLSEDELQNIGKYLKLHHRSLNKSCQL